LNSKNKIILIGNGPSALDHKFGKLIDSYDDVVRFSWFYTKGFEDCVGSKTDIWFTTVADPARMKQSYKQIFEHGWEWRATEDKIYKKLKENYPDMEITKVKRETLEEMQEFVGSKDYWLYSTGAIAAYLFSKEHGQVTLYGFDWWEKRAKHHYGDNLTIGRNHKPDHELKFFLKLAEEERVVNLNPKSKF
jgi:hypothetical protein